MKTITCPNCSQLHALFWMVNKGGKRTLSYRCNKVKVFNVVNKYGDTDRERLGTRNIPWLAEIPGIENENIPEEWSPGYKEDQQNKEQYQIPLMYSKGPTDEPKARD